MNINSFRLSAMDYISVYNHKCTVTWVRVNSLKTEACRTYISSVSLGCIVFVENFFQEVFLVRSSCVCGWVFFWGFFFGVVISAFVLCCSCQRDELTAAVGLFWPSSVCESEWQSRRGSRSAVLWWDTKTKQMKRYRAAQQIHNCCVGDTVLLGVQ